MTQLAGKMQGSKWGLLKLVRIETSRNPNEQRNRRYRAFNMWHDHMNLKRALTQGLKPKKCLKCKLNLKKNETNK